MYFLFAEQNTAGTRGIQAKAFITSGCIDDFVGWYCVFLPVVDQNLNKRILFLLSKKKFHCLPIFIPTILRKDSAFGHLFL